METQKSEIQKALAGLERYKIIADYYLENTSFALGKNGKRLQEIREDIFSKRENLDSRIFYEKSKEVTKTLDYIDFLNNIQFL